MKCLVVGSGISGATAARLIADAGHEVELIEKKSHIGGNCFDYKDEHGITIHEYGSHIFHTSNKTVWEFLERFTDFNTYMHKVVAIIDGIATTIPFNFNTVYDVFPHGLSEKIELELLKKFKYGSKIPIMQFVSQDNEILSFLAQYIYDNVFLNYTRKQWGIDPSKTDGSITARVPILLNKDCRYFQDMYQGIPIGGYTKMIEKIIDHENIHIHLNTDYSTIDPDRFDHIFYTGPIDELAEYKYGQLPYRSVHFKFEYYNTEHYQCNSVVNYPNNYDFTRIHEYKYYLNEMSDVTVIAKEYPEQFEIGKNERYYPIINDQTKQLYEKYSQYVKSVHPQIHLLGRLGDYLYYDMDKSIERAMNVVSSAIDSSKRE